MVEPEPHKGPKPRVAIFEPEFREDLRYWVENGRKVALRAFILVEAILRGPFTGIGKPEPLKYLASGLWSRRLTQEHRIVYMVTDDGVVFLQARYHYLHIDALYTDGQVRAVIVVSEAARS